jgi:hypothetical protein
LGNSCIDWIFKFIIVRPFKSQSPANSPDLNPIEWVWADLKRHVRSNRCKTIEDLLTACKDFQKKVTPEYCQNFINKLKKIVQIVINNDGQILRLSFKLLLYLVFSTILNK